MAMSAIANLKEGLFAVRTGENGNAGLVIAATKPDGQVPYELPARRRISAKKTEKFLQALPTGLRDCIDSHRFTAGVEIYPPPTTTHVEHRVYSPANYSHLVVAFPGRATYGLATARRVAERVDAEGN